MGKNGRYEKREAKNEEGGRERKRRRIYEKEESRERREGRGKKIVGDEGSESDR